MKRMILFALFLNAALLGVIALQLVALAGGDGQVHCFGDPGDGLDIFGGDGVFVKEQVVVF